MFALEFCGEIWSHSKWSSTIQQSCDGHPGMVGCHPQHSPALGWHGSWENFSSHKFRKTEGNGDIH